jgi:membrane fusion protein, multidrug efflux system
LFHHHSLAYKKFAPQTRTKVVKPTLHGTEAGRILLLPNHKAAAQLLAAWCRGELSLSATDQMKLNKNVPSRARRLFGIAPLIAVAIALSGCGQGQPPQAAAAAAPPVTVAQPVKRTVTDWDEFTGRFEAVEEVQVRARVGGFVTNVEFKDGDMVRAGDLLYLIDSRPFEAVAAQADGQLADARAKAELAKRDLDRGLNLVQTSAVSEQVVDQRRQALQAAHAAEVIAEGALKAAQLNVEFTHVLAPIAGRVSRHLVSVGNLVSGSDNGASTLLTSIVSLDPIYIYFDVDEPTYLKNNKLWFEGKRPSSRDTANPVQVALTGETKPSHEGKMDFVDNRLDVSTGTLRSRAVIANKDLSILPGQFGRVRLIGSSPYETLLIPDTAIATDQSRKIVFVVKDDNTVEAKPVVLGPLDEGLRVIREGLQAEDKVIIDGIQRARVGAKVAPHTGTIGGTKS